LIYLKEAMKQNIFPDIRTLVAAPDSKFDADKETMLYAAAGRYLMMYLHEKGLLASLYQNMRYEPGASRETQLEMLLNITGMDEWSFNNAWKNWISGRSVPEKWVSQQAEVEAYITSLAKS
jgi:hypothetical protein